MCADTGVPRYFVKAGNEAAAGGRLRRARTSRCAGRPRRATHEVPLRPNRVHPYERLDHNNNVGINAPEIEYSFEPDADWIDITTVHKGGLFGTDYRMLFPGDGIDGIKRFFLDVMIAFGKRGPGLPAGHRRRRPGRLQGHVDHDPGQAGRLPAGRRRPQPGPARSPSWSWS